MVFDFAPGRRLLNALYEDGDCFTLLSYTENGADHIYSEKIREQIQASPRHRYAIPTGYTYFAFADHHYRWAIERANHVQKFGVAVSVGVFANKYTRDADQCVGLSAFGVDVDDKNFPAFSPEVKTPEEAMPFVIAALAAYGLQPHAIVHSGHGLHVYFLIERFRMLDAKDRQRAVTVWFKLCSILGDSKDRRDLASVLRVPGTLNWKNGEPKLVRFVEEHTDLERERYTLEGLENALASVPNPPERSKPAAVTKRGEGSRVALPTEQPDAFGRWLLSVAHTIDPKLRELEQNRQVRSGGKQSRSERDFAYASSLLRTGLPFQVVADELRRGAKAQENGDPEKYVDRTFSAASPAVYDARNAEKQGSWTVFQNSGEALYKVVIRNRLTPPLSCAPSVAAADSANVTVVGGRPGNTKTTDVVEAASQSRGFPGRTVFVGSFIGEILRHEYAINNTYPTGRFMVVGDTQVVPGGGLPRADGADFLNAIHTRLPEHVKANWPLDKLRRVADPMALLINSTHPLDVDERLVPTEDDAGNLTPPSGYNSWEDRELQSPAAVAKFRGRPDLCPAGHPPDSFTEKHTPCGDCPITACRANTRREESCWGAKRHWKEARFALLTHKAFQYQSVFAPDTVQYANLIVDELPGFVYRYPAIEVKTDKEKGGDMQWDTPLLDDLDGLLREVLESGRWPDLGLTPNDVKRIQRMHAALCEYRTVLTDLARKLRRDARIADPKRHPHEWRVDERSPLFSSADFRFLLRVLQGSLPELPDSDFDNDEAKRGLSEKLLALRDFCGDAPLNVLLQHTFRPFGRGALRMIRPVDGWSDLIGDLDAKVIMLDATAGLDPRYMLRGQFLEERYPDAWFPNTTIVATGEKRTKTKVKQTEEDALTDWICETYKPWAHEVDPDGKAKLLILTDKGTEQRLKARVAAAVAQGKLPATTRIAHFGNLRGKNDFEDFDAVLFTHLHRYDEDFYAGLHLLLSGFKGFPRQWTSKNDPNWKSNYIVDRAMVCDVYQDALRIGIRRDPNRRAHIFLPTDKPSVIVRSMRLFRGATLAYGGHRYMPPGDQLAETGKAA